MMRWGAGRWREAGRDEASHCGREMAWGGARVVERGVAPLCGFGGVEGLFAVGGGGVGEGVA
jgi:hypothetical protein